MTIATVTAEDYLARLRRVGLMSQRPSNRPGMGDRLLKVAHARAWFARSLADELCIEWQSFVQAWQELPDAMGVPYDSVTSWMQRWGMEVSWARYWMTTAASVIRSGDESAGIPEAEELSSIERRLSLEPTTLSIDLSDCGFRREDHDDEGGPNPCRESVEDFLTRMKAAYHRREQLARVPWPGLQLARDSAWFVRYQIGREDLRDIRVPPQGHSGIERTIDSVLMEFALLIGVTPYTSLPRALRAV